MPIYTFRDINTGETFTESMKIAERENYLTQNPHLEQVITAVAFGDSVRLGIRKTDDSFNDLLKYTAKRNKATSINTR